MILLIKYVTKISATALRFTIDFSSLYTNIDTTERIQVVTKVMNKFPDLKRPDEEILELLLINLSRDNFVFNSNYFLQIKGTAMGKEFAPAYANIFMADY